MKLPGWTRLRKLICYLPRLFQNKSKAREVGTNVDQIVKQIAKVGRGGGEGQPAMRNVEWLKMAPPGGCAGNRGGRVGGGIG